MATHPEWQHLALYAVGAAAVLTLLFSIPGVGRVIRAVFSLAVFALVLFVLFQQAPYEPALAKIAERLGLDNQAVVGDEVRIRMAPDGHFWAQVAINGVRRRMLIDTGATVTALSEQTAQLAHVTANETVLPVLVRTANGVVAARTGSIDSLTLGRIRARHLKAVVSPGLGSFDILGMNFLSQLASWRVEGRTLILVPKGAVTPPPSTGPGRTSAARS